MGVLGIILIAILFLAFTTVLVAVVAYTVLCLFKEIIVTVEEIKDRIEGWRKK